MEDEYTTNVTNPAPLKDFLTELKREPCAICFLAPVDWRALNLHNYLTIVKLPMDLGTLEVN